MANLFQFRYSLLFTDFDSRIEKFILWMKHGQIKGTAVSIFWLHKADEKTIKSAGLAHCVHIKLH